jgi:hypothetical protein
MRTILFAVKVFTVALVGLGLLWLYKWHRDNPGADDKSSSFVATMNRERAVKAWMKNNVPDPEAELMAISQPHEVDGDNLIEAKIRAKNRMGGWVIDGRIFALKAGEIVDRGTVEEYLKQVRPRKWHSRKKWKTSMTN